MGLSAGRAAATRPTHHRGLQCKCRDKLEAMLSVLFASVTDTTVPAGDYVPGTPNDGFGSTVADVISTVVDNLGNNVYQTGLSLVAATAASVAMRYLGGH